MAATAGAAAAATATLAADELIKEYLLFRGFTEALRAFESEARQDKDRGFRVRRRGRAAAAVAAVAARSCSPALHPARHRRASACCWLTRRHAR